MKLFKSLLLLMLFQNIAFSQDSEFGKVNLEDTYTTSTKFSSIGRASIVGGKLSLIGSGYAQYPVNVNLSGTSNLALSLSVKFNDVNDLVRFIYLNNSFHIDMSSGSLKFYLFMDKGPVTLSSPKVILDPVKEYKIGMTLSNGELSAWVDGKVVAKVAAPGSLNVSETGINVGGTPWGKYHSGTIDNLKIGTVAIRTTTPVVSGCDCGSKDPAAPCLGNKITYTRQAEGFPVSTISFEFRCDGGTCACGKFANQYDYWVAPKSPKGIVQIIKMTPAATGKADATLRNGWVANPSPTVVSTLMDGRLGNMAGTGLPLNPSTTTPASIDTSKVAVTTLVKSHSMLETGAGCAGSDAATGLSRHCFWQAGVLTVLSQVPTNAGTTVLRPPLTGTEKPLISSNLINHALLPNLPYPTRGDGTVVKGMSMAEALDLLAPPKVEWGVDGKYAYMQFMPPMYNFSKSPGGYPPRAMEGMLDAMQLLILEGLPADKKLLAIRAVQWGMDYYYMWKGRGFGIMYVPNGGHAVGRYLPSVISAALMTGSLGTEMKTNLQRVNNGTGDRCGFDISGEINYWGDTKRTLYGYYNSPGCNGSHDYLTITNSNMVDPAHMGDNGRLAVNEKNIEKEVNSCHGAYQPITAGPTQSTANVIRAIPAAKAIAYKHLIPYTDRVFDYGYYCRPDHYPAATYDKAFGKCIGGVNKGDECNYNKDCPASTCAVESSHQYSSWLARNMYNKYKKCYDSKTCPGMSGL